MDGDVSINYNSSYSSFLLFSVSFFTAINMGHHHLHRHRHSTAHRYGGHSCCTSGSFLPPAPARAISSSQYELPPVMAYPAPIGSYNYNVQPAQAYNAVSLPAGQQSLSTYNNTFADGDLLYAQAMADVRRHSRNERIAEIGAAAAGAFAMYELHEVKVDPAHARRHKLEAEIAGAMALGSASYAYHEHLEKKKSQQVIENLTGRPYNKQDHHKSHGYYDHKNGKKHFW